MSSSKIEDLVRQSFDELYLQRSMKLKGVMLRDLLRKKNLYLLCATHNASVSNITETLLFEYLASTDESIFGQTFLESIASIEREDTKILGVRSQFAYDTIALINLMQKYSTHNRRDFEKEWAKAFNRFEYDFLNNFGNPDGSIDWEKLLQYNSGKENVPWVSKVMPVSVEDQEDDEAEDTDEGVESDG